MKRKDYFKYRVQGGDIYVVPVDIFYELFNELINIQSENKQLKHKLEQSIAVADTNSELADKYKKVIDKISKILYEIDESIKTTGGYPSNYMDELLDILKEVE